MTALGELRFELGELQFGEIHCSCTHHLHMISSGFNPFNYNELDAFPHKRD